MRTRKALSILLTFSVLLALCVSSAFASGSSYTAGLTVAKVDDTKISISCDVGPSGASAAIQGGQGFIVAFNTAIFKPLLKNGTTAFDLASSPRKNQWLSTSGRIRRRWKPGRPTCMRIKAPTARPAF